MADKNKFAPEVLAHINRCSGLIALRASESFEEDMRQEYRDMNIASPIEQMFYTSIHALAKLSDIPHFDADIINGEPTCFGLQIDPQRMIEKYRVDFYIAWHGYGHTSDPKSRKVLVECDSQMWHERSEKERRYEKKRDRDLVRLGYHVFRFTGKEIMDEPFRVALEVLNHVTNTDHSEAIEYINDTEKAPV